MVCVSWVGELRRDLWGCRVLRLRVCGFFLSTCGCGFSRGVRGHGVVVGFKSGSLLLWRCG